MPDVTPEDVSRLLARVPPGDAAALGKVLPLIYTELHAVAERALRGRRDQTLQATALLHEAYLRLANQREIQWKNRAHFIGVAATVMRRVLIDYVRATKAQKRGGEAGRVHLHSGLADADPDDALDLETLDGALSRLAELDARQARIVELRFFGGLSVEDTAEILDLSTATVKREWASAKAWLRREMAQG
jgi:RNA polymerase sigma factor (TIGR02999 family)